MTRGFDDDSIGEPQKSLEREIARLNELTVDTFFNAHSLIINFRQGLDRRVDQTFHLDEAVFYVESVISAFYEFARFVDIVRSLKDKIDNSILRERVTNIFKIRSFSGGLNLVDLEWIVENYEEGDKDLLEIFNAQYDINLSIEDKFDRFTPVLINNLLDCIFNTQMSALELIHFISQIQIVLNPNLRYTEETMAIEIVTLVGYEHRSRNTIELRNDELSGRNLTEIWYNRDPKTPSDLFQIKEDIENIMEQGPEVESIKPKLITASWMINENSFGLLEYLGLKRGRKGVKYEFYPDILSVLLKEDIDINDRAKIFLASLVAITATDDFLIDYLVNGNLPGVGLLTLSKKAFLELGK